eukprot:8812314-Pyramimonas_sp.AAC.1
MQILSLLSRNNVGGLRHKPCEDDLAARGRPTTQGGGFEASANTTRVFCFLRSNGGASWRVSSSEARWRLSLLADWW